MRLLDADIGMRALCFDDENRPRNSCPYSKCLDPKTWASALIVLQRYTHQAESLRTFAEHVLNLFALLHLPDAQKLASLLAESTGETTVAPATTDAPPKTYADVLPLIAEHLPGEAISRLKLRLPDFIRAMDHIITKRLLSDLNAIWLKMDAEHELEELQRQNYLSSAFTAVAIETMRGFDLPEPVNTRMWVGGVYVPLPPSSPHDPR